MSVNNYDKPKRKIQLSIIAIITILIIALSYFIYCRYQQSKTIILPVENYFIESNTEGINLIGEKWLKEYMGQYQQKYLPRNKKIINYTIDSINVLENNIIQINFSVVPKKLNENLAFLLNGAVQEDKIQCQWVLWFSEKPTSNENSIYTVTKFQRPAGYDLEKYNTSGEKEKDEYKNKYVNEVPYKEQKYTYKIQDRILYVSYDGGKAWKEVPVSLEALVQVGDGKAYYNKLQEGSYVITPEKTAFIYGGSRESELMITYTEDMGENWSTAKINSDLDSARVRFCSFPSVKVGYAIVAGGRAMSQEGQSIYQTTDGGTTWKEMGAGPRTSLLYSGGFIDEKVGFMSYPKIEGAETNFYRTEDGGKTFEPIVLPVVKEQWMGVTLEPFIQPEIPYVEQGQLFLLVGQGEQGDFKGGTVMAKYKSNDGGKTWVFVQLEDHPIEEIG